jgi:hypothetical protein
MENGQGQPQQQNDNPAQGGEHQATATGRHLARAAAQGTERARNRLADGLRKRPGLGFLAAGGAGLALANALGVGEAALALASGYFAYQYLRHGRSPSESVTRLMPENGAQQGS